MTIKRPEHWVDKEGKEHEKKVTGSDAIIRIHKIMGNMQTRFEEWFWQDLDCEDRSQASLKSAKILHYSLLHLLHLLHQNSGNLGN